MFEHAITHSVSLGRKKRLIPRSAIFFILLFFPLLFASSAYGATSGMYYVDSISGNDAHSGTSPSAAWRTLAPLHSHGFQPGDVIHFRRGSSWHGGLNITASGQPGQPITFTTYGNSADPRPVFSNSGEWSSSITITANWIVLEGVLVRDAHENGVRIERNAHHNVVRDIEATQVGLGVAVHGQHNLVTESLFYDLTMVENTDDGGVDDWGAVGVVVYDSYNKVSHNTMRGCSAPSYDFGDDGGAIEIYARYGVVEGTRIHNNWSCSNAGFLEIGGVAGGEIRDTVVSYNVTRNSGIFLCMHLDGTFGIKVSNLRIENNTVVETGDGWAVFAFVGDAPTASTMTLRNNIFDVGNYSLFTSRDGFTRSNNLYHLRNPSTQLGFDLNTAAGEKMGDPTFISAAAQDYRLQPGSPAINGGMVLGYTQDHDGMPVPNGTVPDMGAFEYAPPKVALDLPRFIPMLLSR